ncbi:Ran-binding-domain-containing protein, partial [Ramicandelaber brevisporus]
LEELLASLAIQGITLAGRFAFSAAGTMALQHLTDYIKKKRSNDRATPEQEKTAAPSTPATLESRLSIVTPAIDLAEIIAARGNSTMSAVLPMTHSLRHDLDIFSKLLERLGDIDSHDSSNSSNMLDEIDGLLVKLDDVVPFLNLALTTCGANVGSAMAPSVSPGRLMQASNCLIEASSRATAALSTTAVGPLFPLRLFSLFTSSVRAKGMSDVTWCEEFAKCHAQLTRSIDIQPQSTQDDWSASVDTVRSAGFEYHLLITEDLNDGRYHEEIADMRLKSGMIVPGRVRYIPVTNIQRLCYTSSGNLLNIEESRSPVLVLKVVDDNKKNSTVPDWIALELFTEDSDTDDDDTESETDDDEDEEEESESATADDTETGQDTEDGSECEAELGLLEYMLRLSALETCEQRPHQLIPDEKINLFISEDTSKNATMPTDGAITGGLTAPVTPFRSNRLVRSVGTPLSK